MLIVTCAMQAFSKRKALLYGLSLRPTLDSLRFPVFLLAIPHIPAKCPLPVQKPNIHAHHSGLVITQQCFYIAMPRGPGELRCVERTSIHTIPHGPLPRGAYASRDLAFRVSNTGYATHFSPVRPVPPISPPSRDFQSYWTSWWVDFSWCRIFRNFVRRWLCSWRREDD